MHEKLKSNTGVGPKFGVLFVCTGNICRSPTAQGIFRRQVQAAGLDELILSDSAGTGGYHIGEPPDPRAVEAAARRGYDIADLRARRIERVDFDRFDVILAMDRGHQAQLLRLARPSEARKVKMLMQFARRHPVIEVPDPYFGGAEGFERVLDMLEDAAQGLLQALCKDLAIR